MQIKRVYYLVYPEIQKHFIIASTAMGFMGLTFIILMLNLLPPVLSALSFNHQLPTCNFVTLASPIGIWLILASIVFLIFISILGLLVSHKVAGPLYGFRKALEDRISGEGKRWASIRENDLGEELADLLNQYFKRQDEIEDEAKKLLASLKEQGVEVDKKLEGMLQR